MSNNPLAVVLAVLLVAGAIFYFVGGVIVRRADRDARELRLDMIERLMLVGQPWCVEELETLRADETDPSIREAAEAALLVIRSR